MPYFDTNATTPPSPAALAAEREISEQAWHNPSSPYRAAARAHALLEDARERLATLVGGNAKDYVFNSGATEANNAVLAHAANVTSAGARVVVSAVEHPSVLESAQAYFVDRVTLLPSDARGVTRLEVLEETLREGNVALVSLMAANNETGVLQPWREARVMAKAHGVLFHCDAAQWLGKLPSDTLAECDFLTGCAHKFCGTKGVGFLKVPAGDRVFHGLRGGEQEHGRRAGTENLAGICAMVAALETVSPRLAREQASWMHARELFEKALPTAVPGVEIVGADVERLWNTVMFLAPRHENTRWVAALDKRGFQVSTGSACATGSDGPSHVLAAMGVRPEEARRALRVSAGWDTTTAEWDGLLAALAEAQVALDESA